MAWRMRVFELAARNDARRARVVAYARHGGYASAQLVANRHDGDGGWIFKSRAMPTLFIA